MHIAGFGSKLLIPLHQIHLMYRESISNTVFFFSYHQRVQHDSFWAMLFNMTNMQPTVLGVRL
jgi:hypothetical protein